MKKLFVSILALTALTGVAVAGERERDLRLSDPSYGPSYGDTARSSGPDVFVDRYQVIQSPVEMFSDMSINRLDEKNGSRG